MEGEIINKNIEVINEKLWAVRFSYLPYITELEYSGDSNRLEFRVASFTNDGKIVLNKQHEIYSILKAMLQRIMPNSDQELVDKINAAKSKEQDQYVKFYLFVLDTEIKRRSIRKNVPAALAQLK